MRVLLINSVCGIRSTGRICTDIAIDLEKNGHEVKIAYGREDVPEKFEKYAVRIGSDLDNIFSAIHSRITDKHGFANKRATRKLLKWADEYDPDILWLHNIHGYYINIEILFEWIKSRPEMQVKWTLHDCWAFTGHCTHFTAVGCDKWKIHCEKCVQKDQYPTAVLCDNSSSNYDRKRNAFCGVKNMTLITPSKWLAEHVKCSFLNEYSVEVVYNTVNTSVFKPTPSNFREKYGLSDKKIILGVATTWTERKGLFDFFELAKVIDKDSVILLVGLNDNQIKRLPENIIGINCIDCTNELAKIYTAADVFLNASREETFGLTTVEALLCGTPVIVYKDTACEEIVCKYADDMGSVVDRVGDIESLNAAIIEMAHRKVNM